MSDVVHLGDSEERQGTLCGERVTYEQGCTNVDVDPSWSDDASWLDRVTCTLCLKQAIKIGDDAKRRLAELEAKR